MAMPEERENGPQVDDLAAVRAEWLEQLFALASQVKVWAEKSHWRTRMVSRPTRDSVLGRFEVPLLLMEHGYLHKSHADRHYANLFGMDALRLVA